VSDRVDRVRRHRGAPGSGRATGAAPPRAGRDRGVPVRRRRGEPARNGGAERVLSPGGRAGGLQPAAGPGGADEEGWGGLARRRGRGRRAGRAGVRRRGPIGASFQGEAEMNPSPGDGRNIDPASGILEGEASEQKVPAERERREGAVPFDVWSSPSGDGSTYYGRPVLKEPVWIWSVPAYFYAGGTAGASAVLAAAAQVIDRDELDGLIKRARVIAAAG